MKNKRVVLTTGFVLWILGILVGASAGDLLPGSSRVSSQFTLTVALLASLGNFAVLYRKLG